MKKKNLNRPWLTPTGVAIPTQELRAVCKAWTPEIWEQYLTWFEGGRKEQLVSPAAYQLCGEKISKSIFDSHGPTRNPFDEKFCARLLATLPELEAEVLKRYFFGGKTEVESAADLRRSQPGVHKIKHRALKRLKRGNSGDEVIARRFMRGVEISTPTTTPSIWDKKLDQPITKRGQRPSVSHQNRVLAQIENYALRLAMDTLSERQRRVLYLRFWCGFTTAQIARDLSTGINIVEMLEGAAISKVKRETLKEEILNMGGDVCV